MTTKWIDKLDEKTLRNIALNIGVDPALAVALWEQESSRGKNLKEHATSRYGLVRGPLQVTDVTFKENFPRGRIDSQIDNAIAGLTYLKKWIDKSGGDVEAALQAYHSGSPGVTRQDKDGNVFFKKDSLGKLTGSYAQDVLRRQAKIGRENFDARDYKNLMSQDDLEFDLDKVFNDASTPESDTSLFSKEMDTGMAMDFDPYAYLTSSDFDGFLDNMFDEVISERSMYG